MQELSEKEFIVNVGPHSNFNRSGNYQTRPEDIDSMFEAYEKKGDTKIAIFFHGGLVSEKNGLKGARNIAPHLHNGGYAPVCFVWETGLFETIVTNISKIGGTKLFNKLLKALLKKVSEKVTVSDSSGRGADVNGLSYAEIDVELSQPVPFEDFDRKDSVLRGRGPATVEQVDLLLESELRAELRQLIENDVDFVEAIAQTRLAVSDSNEVANGRGIVSIISFVARAAKIAYLIIKRFIEKRDHGFYPTVVEEILREFYIAELGAWVWKSMKDKSREMWKSNANRSGLGQFVGRYFLDKLIAFKSKHPEAKISLIGHSAGSIAICNLLNSLAENNQQMEFEHIIFMAPACTVSLFEKDIIQSTIAFKDIRVFTMSDEHECKDILVPFVYTRSLLYLISGILENEGDSYDEYIMGLERHIRFKPPYQLDVLKGCHDYIYFEGLQRISFSITTETVPGMETEAKKHGDFDDDPATLRSIVSILQH